MVLVRPNIFVRWAERGVWERLPRELAAPIGPGSDDQLDPHQGDIIRSATVGRKEGSF